MMSVLIIWRKYKKHGQINPRGYCEACCSLWRMRFRFESASTGIPVYFLSRSRIPLKSICVRIAGIKTRHYEHYEPVFDVT